MTISVTVESRWTTRATLPFAAVPFRIRIAGARPDEGVIDALAGLPTSFLKLRTRCNAVPETSAIRAAFDSANLPEAPWRLEILQEGWNTLVRFKEDRLQIHEDSLVIVLIDKSGRNARSTTTTCTSDAVDVVLDLLWHVEVDDVLDSREIETLRRDIRADQNILGAFLERTN